MLYLTHTSHSCGEHITESQKLSVGQFPINVAYVTTSISITDVSLNMNSVLNDFTEFCKLFPFNFIKRDGKCSLSPGCVIRSFLLLV
jgi:hypothetical protein